MVELENAVVSIIDIDLIIRKGAAECRITDVTHIPSSVREGIPSRIYFSGFLPPTLPDAKSPASRKGGGAWSSNGLKSTGTTDNKKKQPP